MPFADLAFTPGIYYSFDFTSDNILLNAGTQDAFMVGVDINSGSTSFEPMGGAGTNSDVDPGGTAIHDFGGGAFTLSADTV